MPVLTRLAADLFQVDLRDLSRESTGSRLGSILHGLFQSDEPVQVDPWVLSRAVMVVLEACRMRSPSGRPLVWNEYLVFLSREDHERLRPLEALVGAELKPLLQDRIQEMQASLVGPLTIRLLQDESAGPRSGTLQIRVSFIPSVQAVAPGAGEITVRMSHATTVEAVLDGAGWASEESYLGPGAEWPPAWPPTDPPPPSETTERQDEPVPGVRVSWPGGNAVIPEGVRVFLGRPHLDPQGSFIALEGAGPRINRKQLWIECTAGTVMIGRPNDANPVQVMGRLIAPGRTISVEDLPVEVSLSTGEVLLQLLRVESP